jgi:hypothetical protein
VICTLLITVLVEGIAAALYSVWQRKPMWPILLTSVVGNLLTQSLLWLVLTFSFNDYVAALVLAEIAIWGIESFLFHAIPANHLDLKEAALLSLGLNGISLALGWFLPV